MAGVRHLFMVTSRSSRIECGLRFEMEVFSQSSRLAILESMIE